MTTTEEFLEQHICPECHVAILEPHPEEHLMDLGYIKCPLCGFGKLIEKEPLIIHQIIFGKDESE